MIDLRLLDPRFNPIDDNATATHIKPEVVTLFDRAMLAAMPMMVRSMVTEPDRAIAMASADLAIAFLEERAHRLGIEVTP